MTARSFVIEFVGPPGVGKTTIADALSIATALPSRLIDGYSDSDGSPFSHGRLRQARIQSVLAQPRLAALVARQFLRAGPGETLSWALNLTRRNFIQRQLVGNVILEEGVLSALCLLNSTDSTISRETKRIHPYLESAEIIILLNADTEEIVSRIRSRSGILSDYPDDRLTRLTEAYKRNMREVALQAGGSVIELDTGTTPPEDASVYILRQLSQLSPPWGLI